MLAYRWVLLQTSSGHTAALKVFNCTTIASSENAADAEDVSDTNYFDEIAPGHCVFVSDVRRFESICGCFSVLSSSLDTRIQWWPDVQSLLESDLVWHHAFFV